MSSVKTVPALQNASVNDPACITAGDACPAFQAAHTLSQKEVSYYHQYDYGHYVSWFLVVLWASSPSPMGTTSGRGAGRILPSYHRRVW